MSDKNHKNDQKSRDSLDSLRKKAAGRKKTSDSASKKHSSGKKSERDGRADKPAYKKSKQYDRHAGRDGDGAKRKKHTGDRAVTKDKSASEDYFDRDAFKDKQAAKKKQAAKIRTQNNTQDPNAGRGHGGGNRDEDGTIKGERIAKIMARAGLCSRRDAERWIADGRVRVNGKILDTPACIITPNDSVIVDGKPLQRQEQTRLFIYNKPVGLVVSHKDEQGRATVFDSLPDRLPRVISVGRLDINSEGLLLLTNDGELSRYMELPATGWKRQYRVRVLGRVNNTRLERLKDGIKIEGIQYGPIEARIDDARLSGAPSKTASGKTYDGGNTWISVSLREGKNREIRKVMEALGLQVNRLMRLNYGPFTLGKIQKGQVEEIGQRMMRDQIPDFFK